MDDSVLDDCDFLLELAEEAAQEKGLVPPVPPANNLNSGTGFRAARPVVQPPPTPCIPGGAASGFYIEQVSKIKVSRPVVGSLVVKERLTDGIYYNLKDIPKAYNRPATGWTTLVVLASKVQAQSQNGNMYSRWQVTDLAGTSVTLFLFGAANLEHYKETEGSVLILYSPKFKHEEHGKHNSFSLSVDKEAQVQRIGAAADMAHCLGKKPDGSRCNNVVNRSECEYCLYHAKAALKQFSNRRPDVQGRSLFEMQLKPVVDKAERMRAAQRQPAAARQLTGLEMGAVATSLAAVAPPQGTAPAGTMGSGNGGKRQRGLNQVLAASRLEQERDAKRMRAAHPEGRSCSPSSQGGIHNDGRPVSDTKARLLATLQRSSSQTQPNSSSSRSRTLQSDSNRAHSSAPSATRQLPSNRSKAAATTTGRAGRPTEGLMRTQAAAGAAHSHTPKVARSTTGQPVPADASKPRTSNGDIAVAGPSARNTGNAQSAGQVQGSQGLGGGAAHARRQQQQHDKQSVPEDPLEAMAALAAAAADDADDGGELEIVEGWGGDACMQGTHACVRAEVAAGLSQGHPSKQGVGGGGSTKAKGTCGEEEEDGLEIVDDEDGERACSPSTVPPLQHLQQQQHEEEQQQQQQEQHQLHREESACHQQQQQKQEQQLPLRLQASSLGQQLPHCSASIEARPSSQERESCLISAPAANQTSAPAANQISVPAKNQTSVPAKNQTSVPASSQIGAKSTTASHSPPNTAATPAAATTAHGVPDSSRVLRPLPNGAGANRNTGSTLTAVSKGAPAGKQPPVKGQLRVPPADKRTTNMLVSLGLAKKAPAKPPGQPQAPGKQQHRGQSQQQQEQQQQQQRQRQQQQRRQQQNASRPRSSSQGGSIGGGGAPASAMAAAFGGVVSTIPDTCLESSYAELGEEAEFERLTGVMDQFERRDQLVQKLEAVTKLQVTALHCKECNRFSERRNAHCRDHTVTRVTTTKRWWQCLHCNAHFTTLGVIFPSRRCPRCNDPGMAFRASSMAMSSGSSKARKPDPNSAVALRENFLPRGVEQGFSLNSGQ